MNSKTPSSSDINQLTNKLIEEMQNHPQKVVTWQNRNQLYQLFEGFDYPTKHLIMAWLSILAAQKVLPIAQIEMPFNSIPLLLVGLAIDELSPYINESESWGKWNNKSRHNERIIDLSAFVYISSSNGHTDGYFDQHKHNLEMVFETAESALDAARGLLNPPKELNPYERERFFGCSYGSDTDTAELASVAFSCDSSSYKCNIEKSEEFWFWWLTKAIPQAIKLASWDVVSASNINSSHKFSTGQ